MHVVQRDRHLLSLRVFREKCELASASDMCWSRRHALDDLAVVAEAVEPCGIVADVDFCIAVDGEHLDHVNVVESLSTTPTGCTCGDVATMLLRDAHVDDDGGDAGQGEYNQ